MNKYLKGFLYIMPVIILVGSIGTYFVLTNVKSERKDNFEKITHFETKQSEENNLKIFPEISNHDLYKDIWVKDGKAIISDDFIAKVVTIVINKMQFTKGELKWGYKFEDEQTREKIKISFVFKPELPILGKTEIQRDYDFQINQP